MEKLTNIRNTARTSRKNEKNLHTWSFHRLSKFIEYKAKLAGIKVEYVNPKYTSQVCPNCGTINKAKDRSYQCSCGFKIVDIAREKAKKLIEQGVREPLSSGKLEAMARIAQKFEENL